MDFPPSQFNALAAHYDELMQVVPYDEWAEYCMTLWSFAGHTPRRVLDCACGTGNVSFELAGRGLEVVGVDLSAQMIGAAQRKLADEDLSASVTRQEYSLSSTPSAFRTPPRFVAADLCDFALGETFDAATCLYDSLNYILEPDKLQQAFARIAAHIEPRGVFVFDMNSEHALSADLFTQRSLDPRKALHYNWQARFDPETRICTVDMEFTRRNDNGSLDIFHETHRERAYSQREVAAMLHAAGWEMLHTFDAYTLNPTHDRSERWYFVARRL